MLKGIEMEIKEFKVTDLKEYERNPRHNDDAVEYVAESIKEFGFKVPIVVDKDNVIIAGHTRLKAAKELGLEIVPCIVADDLTEEQVQAFRLADNKTAEMANWDFGLLSDELFQIEDIDMELFGFEDSVEDEFEDIDDEEMGGTKPFEHKLKCGKVEAILTQEEYDELFDRFQEYIDENGVSFGFVSELLKND